MRVPLSIPEIGEEEIQAVTEVLRRKWLTMGSETQAFEAEFAEMVGAPHAFAVSNCTTALHLSLLALDLKPDDEVLVPSLSFVATANVVRYAGAVPVFVEVASENDLNLSLEDTRQRITPKTKGIIAVHYAGYPADLSGLRALATEHNLFYVEDAAQAAGAGRDGVACGASGDAACFSFYSTKNATTGEGGMLTTGRDDVAERVRLLRSHALTASVLERDRGERFGYDVVGLGYNYRIDEMRAAMGRVQIKRLIPGNRRRAEITERYREKLAALDGIGVPFADHPGRSAHHLMPIVLPEGVDRTQLAATLRESGVQTSVHYKPIHLMRYYRDTMGTGDGLLPRTESIAQRELTLPLYAGLTDAQVDYVVDVLTRSLQS